MGMIKTIAVPQHKKARRPRGRRRCVGPNLSRLGHRRGAEGAHVHAHDDCCKRCAAEIGREIFPRIIERVAREPWRILLREGPSTISCVPDNVPNPTKPNMTGRYSTRAKNVIGWSIRLIVRRSTAQHEKPDAPCRVRRRVGPPRHRHWRAYPRSLQQNTCHSEGR